MFLRSSYPCVVLHNDAVREEGSQEACEYYAQGQSSIHSGEWEVWKRNGNATNTREYYYSHSYKNGEKV